MRATTFAIKKSLTSLGLVFSAALAPLPAAAYNGLVIFGDSLSDSGNNSLLGLADAAQVVTGNSYIPDATYQAAPGTYSNGPVWASYFAASMGLSALPSLAGGGNYAYGGATTGTNQPLPSPPFPPGFFLPSLRTQSMSFLAAAGGADLSDTLFVVAGGGNNARAAASAIAGGADINTTIATTAASFASDVDTIVNSLQGAGAKYIIVWNAPNLGLAPAVAAQGPGAVFLGSALTGNMNLALAGALADEGPDVKVFDLYGILPTLAASFANVTDACGAVAGADCSTYAFWDGIHPTTAAHAQLARSMQALAVPEPSTYALFALGLAGLVAAQRRRAAKPSPAA